MALKSIVKESSSLDSGAVDGIVENLAMEITVGGDRFDREDLCYMMIQAGGSVEDFTGLRGRVVEAAKTMQPVSEGTVEFFNSCLDYWLDAEYFEKCRVLAAYVPAPEPYEHVFLSSDEARFAGLLERELHSIYRLNRSIEGWMAPGDYKSMLFAALPCLNDNLEIQGKVLRNTIKGYIYNCRLLESYSPEERLSIAVKALQAAGIMNRVNFSDKLRRWDELSDDDRLHFNNLSWAIVKSYKALGFKMESSKGFLGIRKSPGVNALDFEKRMVRQIHEVLAQRETDCRSKARVPFNQLSFDMLKERKEMVCAMQDLLERQGLRTVVVKNKNRNVVKQNGI